MLCRAREDGQCAQRNSCCTRRANAAPPWQQAIQHAVVLAPQAFLFPPMCSMQSVPCLSRWCHACRHLHTPQGDLSSRRQAANLVNGEAPLHKLFSELAPRYAERQGGYTRIIRTGVHSLCFCLHWGCWSAVVQIECGD